METVLRFPDVSPLYNYDAHGRRPETAPCRLQAVPSRAASVVAAMREDFPGNTVCISAHRPYNAWQYGVTGMAGNVSFQVLIMRCGDI